MLSFEPRSPLSQSSGRLLNRDFVLLWQGQLASHLGNQAFLVAAMSWMLEATSSSLLMGLWLMSASLPAVLFGPFAGALVDRHSRRTLIVCSDLARGVAHLGVAAVMSTAPGAKHTLLGLFLVLACLSGALGALVTPALAAAIPDLVPPRKLAAGNALHHISSQAATLVGQAAGGVAYVWIGAPALIFFDGLTFLLSAACARFARVPPTNHPKPAGAAPPVAYAADVRAGVTWLWAQRSLRSVTLAFAAANFLFTPVFVLLPIYVRDVLGLGPQWYGFLLAGAGAGALAGAVLALRIQSKPGYLAAALAGIGGCITALGVNDSPGMALSLLFMGGLLSSVLNVGVITTLQSATPPELRGRVLGATSSLAGAAVPAGLGLGGLIGALGPSVLPEVICACGLGMLGVAACFGAKTRVG